MQDARQNIAAKLVGTHPVLRVGGHHAGAKVALQRVKGRDIACQQSQQQHQANQGRADRERPVRQQPTEKAGAVCQGSAQSNARVNHGVQQVDHQVNRQVDQRQKQQAALNYRKVARKHRPNDQPAQAWNRKHLLCDHSAP